MRTARVQQNDEPIAGRRVTGESNRGPRIPEIPELIVMAEGTMARIFDTKTQKLSEPMSREEALRRAAPPDV